VTYLSFELTDTLVLTLVVTLVVATFLLLVFDIIIYLQGLVS